MCRFDVLPILKVIEQHGQSGHLLARVSEDTFEDSTAFVLRDIDRGEHNIQLELLDQSGKLIATSPLTTFYLHRASLITPN
ncbi:hypothetical protein [Alishewanella longhuensis]